MINKRLSYNRKSICSVTDLVRSLGISRARFYQLQKEGIFPQALYDIRTRRPFFDTKLQGICHEVRETGIGFNGQYILFYSPRKTDSEKPVRRRRKSNSKFKDFTEVINNMGLEVSNADVQEALKTLFPTGIKNIDRGIAIREIFRYLKGKL